MDVRYLDKSTLQIIANSENDPVWILQEHIKMLLKHIELQGEVIKQLGDDITFQAARISELQETGTKLVLENRELKGKISESP